MTQEEILEVVEKLKDSSNISQLIVGGNGMYVKNQNVINQYASPCADKDGEATTKSDCSDEPNIIEAIQLLMERRDANRKWIMEYQYQWMGIFRVLADRGLFSASDYVGFCQYFEGYDFRIPLSHDSLRQAAKAKIYDVPVSRWRYDPAYEPKREKYDRIKLAAITLQEILNRQMKG